MGRAQCQMAVARFGQQQCGGVGVQQARYLHHQEVVQGGRLLMALGAVGKVEQQRLRPVGQPQPLDDAGDVGVDDRLGDEQAQGDLLVAQPLGRQAQHLVLAVGQGAGIVALRLGQQAGGDLGRKLGAAGGGSLDSPAQVVSLGVFEQVADGPGADDGRDGRFLDDAGDDDDLCRQAAAANLGRGL